MKLACAGWLLVAWNSMAHADVAACSHYVSQSSSMSAAVEFLRSVAGSYQIGDCSVELHVCQSDSNDNSHGSVVGDLLITNSRGAERYIQIEMPESSSPGLRTMLLQNKLMFHYESDDVVQTSAFGRRESVRLEILKSDNRRSLVSLDEGWFASKDWQARKKGSVYQWLNCRGQVALPILNSNTTAPDPTAPEELDPISAASQGNR